MDIKRKDHDVIKYKKLTAILAFLFLSFSLSACGKQQQAETSVEAEVETEESKVEEEEEQSKIADKVDGTEVETSEVNETVAKEESKAAEHTETVAHASETASVSAQETYTDTIPETITMDPNFVKCSMNVVYDTQVKDAPYAASGNQGLIARGSNIGVMEAPFK